MLKTRCSYTQMILAVAAIATMLSLVNCNNNGFEVADSCFNDGGDPLFSYSWHLVNCGQKVFAKNGGAAGMDMNLRATWSSGLTGNGIRIRVSDDGLENTHEDLTGNFQTAVALSRDYISGIVGNSYKTTTAVPRDGTDINGDPYYDDHGTAVAGLIAAVGGNGKGSRGVAPKASLSSANFISGGSSQSPSMLLNQADGNDFDISNMSWGTAQNGIADPTPSYEATLKTGVTTFRSGKGAIYVKSAGNSFAARCNDEAIRTYNCVGNSNFDGDNTNPYQIIVAALNAKGTSADYSSPGANIWISGFGGLFGDTDPAMFTTDRTGCLNGFSMTGVTTNTSFDRGSSQNPNCNYSVEFNGTSSAAPTITGAVALLLEANPSLTWRDVKYILAKTAVPVDYVTTGSIPYPGKTGRSTPVGYSWEIPWRTNGAGYKFQNWYGFGKIDVDAAVSMAKSYTSALGTYTEANWISTGAISVPIGDNSVANAALSQINVSNGGNGALKIEAIRLKVSVTHTDISQLALELTSPSGMRSIVVNMHNSLKSVDNYVDDVFLSNAFYGERSEGLWTLKVIDGLSGDTGTLTGWQLQVIGAP